MLVVGDISWEVVIDAVGAARVSRGEEAGSLGSPRGGRLLGRDKISIQQKRTTCRLARRLMGEHLHRKRWQQCPLLLRGLESMEVTDERSESSWHQIRLLGGVGSRETGRTILGSFCELNQQERLARNNHI